MKKLALILCLSLLIPLYPAKAGRGSLKTESKPNFSGIWVLDMTETNFGIPKRDIKYSSLNLTISHHDSEMKIVCKRAEKKKERALELIYYTDGRGEKNPSFNDREEVQTKTYWEGGALITRGSGSQASFGDTIMYDIVDKWELSADGSILIESSSYSPLRSKFGKFNFGSFGARNARKVFKKAHNIE